MNEYHKVGHRTTPEKKRELEIQFTEIVNRLEVKSGMDKFHKTDNEEIKFNFSNITYNSTTYFLGLFEIKTFRDSTSAIFKANYFNNVISKVIDEPTDLKEFIKCFKKLVKLLLKEETLAFEVLNYYQIEDSLKEIDLFLNFYETTLTLGTNISVNIQNKIIYLNDYNNVKLLFISTITSTAEYEIEYMENLNTVHVFFNEMFSNSESVFKEIKTELKSLLLQMLYKNQVSVKYDSYLINNIHFDNTKFFDIRENPNDLLKNIKELFVPEFNNVFESLSFITNIYTAIFQIEKPKPPTAKGNDISDFKERYKDEFSYFKTKGKFWYYNPIKQTIIWSNSEKVLLNLIHSCVSGIKVPKESIIQKEIYGGYTQ